MKNKTIPVIVEELGMIKKETQKYVTEIPGNLPLIIIITLLLLLLLFLTPIILHLNYTFIQILCEFFNAALY